MNKQYDITVVGAGMVGMACALGLAKKGFSVAIIESQALCHYHFPTSDEPYDSRVVAISRASEDLFEQLGVLESIKASRFSAYEDMIIWDSERDGFVHFSASSLFEPNLGLIIEQRVILSALWQAVQTHPAITYFFNTTIQAIRLEALACIVECGDQATITSALLVGADGARSTVRDMLQMESIMHDYEQTAVVATLRSSLPHHATAYQRFAKDGPLAWLPLADPYLTSIVWSTTPEYAKTLCELSEEVFNQRVTQECDGKLGTLRLVGRRIMYPLRTHHAKRYVLPRCALVGDAAHTIHPLAGMGVNLGFLDVMVLIEVLAKAKAAKRDLGALGGLKRYERKRRWHNGVMRQAMSVFKTTFGSTSVFVQTIRNKGLRYINQRPTAKRFFIVRALFGK